MITKIIEATENTKFNWGKFLVGQFDDEWEVSSSVACNKSLLSIRGWTKEHFLVLDLETGEGAIFNHGGCAVSDLHKHRIWVCPLFENFLQWLYLQNFVSVMELPSFVNLGDVYTAIWGYRREGAEHKD